MTSSDHHRSSTSAAGPSIRPVDSGSNFSAAIEEEEGDEEEYEFEYEEIEVEEEIEEEEEIEVEEDEDPEEDEELAVEEFKEEEELTMEELKEEEEEDPQEEQEDEEEASEVEDDDDEEEQVHRAQEEKDTGAPNSSIAAPNEDASQDLFPKRHDDFSQSNLSNYMLNHETMAPSKSDSEVGNTTDDKSSGPLERLIKNVELESDDQSARKYVLMSNGCQLEVHAEGDKDVDLAHTLKITHIDFQQEDCSGDIGAKLDKLMDVKNSQVPQLNEKKITSESSFKGDIGGEINPVSDSMEIDEQSDMQPMDEISKTASRFSAPLTRSRSVSPETEGIDREKRPALICEFFAKGWCIKGSACRFLHKRDNNGNASQILGGDIALQNSGGSRGHAESPSSPDGSGFVTSSRDITGGVLEQNISSDMPTVSRSRSEVHHNFSEHESVFRGFGLSIDSRNQSSYHPSVEEASLRSGEYLLNEHSASGVGYSVNNSRMPHWRSILSSHSSMRQDCLAPHKTFSGDKGDDGFRSLLLPSSGSGMGRSYHISTSRESRFSYGYKSKFVPYNWEPSAPFRLSFSVPSLSTSSLGCQYDPIRDSIEQPNEDTLVKPSPGDGLSFHGKSYSWNPDKRQSCSDQKDIPVMEAESASASATDAQAHNSMPKDVKCGSNHQNNAARHRIEQKVEKEWQNSEVDLDPVEYEAIHRESKALKHFRAALVEFVKDLLRPMWHEGLLTKDAFKIIVQKAEEKIVNSCLQTNQIPATVEQINQYLSSSQTKILKLLEGYAVKYRKSVSSQSVV